MKIVIIVASAKNNVIGSDGKIPWHSKAELQHFKNTTMSYPIIMGRKTFESIGRILPGRLNIVISRNKNLELPDEAVLANSVDNAIDFCKNNNFEKVFIIGGGSIYKSAFDIADQIILTKMDMEPAGDTYFPSIRDEEWKEVNFEERDEFTVITYEKRTS